MKTKFIVLAIVTLAIAACAKTVERPDVSQTIIRAYQEGAVDTKTTVQDGGTQVYWEPNDEIKVFFKGNGGRFISQNSYLASIADFTGTLNIAVGANEGASSSNLTWGLYPYRADAISDGSSVTTTLPAEQTGRAGSFAKNTHICLAAEGGFDLAFYNVTGGIRFSLTQEGIKSVTFQGNNDENLAGKIKIAFEGGIPAIKEVSNGEKVITLNATGGGTFQTGQWYYIEAIPGTLSKGFKMTFSKGNESAKLNSSSSVTIGRGKYGSLADADEGLIFKESGSGDAPDPSSVIQFADPIAKYACVEKFDTDGDGEVSYEEAAAVTSLEGLFTDWNTVTSFDEIKYFTSVTSTNRVFNGLTKLVSITIPNFITTLGSFQNCSSLSTVVLPSNQTSLPDYCFDGCKALSKVTLPNEITSIPDYCFRYCVTLENVDLPVSVDAIGKYAFYGCSGLSSIDLPANITSIGQYAFSLCSALTSVGLPSKITNVSTGLFKNCSSLRSVSWPAELSSIGREAFYECFVSKDDSDAFLIELPSSIVSIGSQAFWGVRHLCLPSTTLVTIASDSFSRGFTRLYVPSSMVEMYKVRTNWSAYNGQILPIESYPANLSSPVAEVVDLGLSVKWASWNVGATAPEDYGWYFQWGEVEGDWYYYNVSSYKWWNNDYSKYNDVDNKTILDPADDAAHIQWGGSWRMPTKEECEELIENSTWEWKTINGVEGHLVTSTKEGFTDKHIFLPASGYREWGSTSSGTSGYYWTSTLSSFTRIINNNEPEFAYYLYYGMASNMASVLYSNYSYSRHRMDGFSIRPVCP